MTISAKNNLLCEQQYGFRSKHSTELATIKLVDYLLKKMDDNHIPDAIYLDLSILKLLTLLILTSCLVS